MYMREILHTYIECRLTDFLTSLPVGVRSIVISVSVCPFCLSVCLSVRLHISETTSKGKLVKGGFLYSAAYATTGPARFTISEVAVDWQEPMVLQRKLRPSNCTR